MTGARVTLEDGTWPVLEVSPAAADVIADLDGLRTLRELSATPDAVALVPGAARARSARARGRHIRCLSASTPATNGFVTG